MKLFLLLASMLCASAAFAADKPAAAQSPSVSGKVLEVQHAGDFTYMRLKTRDGETWAAAPRAAIDKGADVTLTDPVVMTNLHSMLLKRKFDRVVFGKLAGTAPQGGSAVAAAHAGIATAPAVADLSVAKAIGPNARTVAEIVGGGAKLKDKPVLVRGKVVKYNPGILGKNWIHLRDGSGSPADRTNDVLVTSTRETRVGDVVLVKGVVKTNQDFGAGYSYPVLIEATELSTR